MAGGAVRRVGFGGGGVPGGAIWGGGGGGCPKQPPLSITSNSQYHVKYNFLKTSSKTSYTQTQTRMENNKHEGASQKKSENAYPRAGGFALHQLAPQCCGLLKPGQGDQGAKCGHTMTQNYHVQALPSIQLLLRGGASSYWNTHRGAESEQTLGSCCNKLGIARWGSCTPCSPQPWTLHDSGLRGPLQRGAQCRCA